MTTITKNTAAELKRALKIVEPAVAKNSSVAILSHVLVGDGAIVATNMVASISCPFDASLGIDPVVILFADLKRLASALKAGDDIRLSVKYDDGAEYIAVNTTRGETLIPTGNIDDWPTLSLGPAISDINFEDPESALKSILDTSAAMSNDEARPVLCSMLFEKNGDNIRIAATDSFRLAVEDGIASAYSWDDDLRLCVPRIGDLLKNAGGISYVSVQKTNNIDHGQKTYVSFYCNEGIVIRTRTVDGTFPNIDALIPTSHESTFCIPAGLSDALVFAEKAVGAKTRRNIPPARIEVDASTNEMHVSLDGRGGSRHSAIIAIDENDHVADSMTIGLNSSFLVDGIGFVNGLTSDREPTMSLISPLRPVLLESGSRSYLLMPVRLPN